MEWIQVYDPFHSLLWSTLVAGLPIVLLLGLLAAGISAPRAAGIALAAALATAIFGFHMPWDAGLAAAVNGACFGLFPIGWIVFNAVFLYQLTVRTGQFEIVKRSVAAISPDRRIQALLIAFCFGTFLEGAAGFGTPVAITSAVLIGLGFSPLYAAGLSLIANTAPVAFGALGTPILTLAKFSGLPEMALSQMAGRQLAIFAVIIPAWLVATMSGWKGLKGCWPAVLVCGGSFSAIQFFTSNYHGPMLVNVLGGVGSMLILIVFLQFWKPKEIWRFPGETASNDGALHAPCAAPQDGNPRGEQPSLTGRKIAYAWMPWVILSFMVFLWGWPAWKQWLNDGAHNPLRKISNVQVEVPRLHNRIYRTAPVVKIPEGSNRAAEPEKAIYDFNWLSSTGTSIFLAAVFSALWLRIGLRVFTLEFLLTLHRVRWALATIACMLALALLTKFSGTDATLGLAFTKTGWFYPFFAPLLGWLGVALTGSDTSANALFGSLQKITADQLGLPPVLIVASNSTGGVMGKMIDAQSIVVAAVATGQSGGEGKILRFVFFHSLVLALLMGLLTLAQAYCLTWMIPGL
jgi:lactate permease